MPALGGGVSVGDLLRAISNSLKGQERRKTLFATSSQGFAESSHV